MSSIQIYIPRILGSVKKKDIIEAFRFMDIGSCEDIDMKYKINENKNGYYYAFIKINLFSSIRAKTFQNSVRESGMIRLIYDEEKAQYWEIKHHVKKNDRSHTKLNTTIPFYRFKTLLSQNTEIKPTTQSPVYKPYNMWDNSFDILQERRGDLLC